MISFEQCDVTINGTGIVAESAILESNAPLAAAPILGHTYPYAYAKQGFIRTSAQINYVIESDREPNFGMVTFHKNYTGEAGINPIPIVVGGVTGQFYLNSWSLSSSEHEPIKASVSYIGFTPLSGSLAQKSNTVQYNVGSGSGFAHVYIAQLSMRFQNDGNQNALVTRYTSKNIFAFNYEFRTSLNPVHVIGSKYPSEVKHFGAQESVRILHNHFTPIDSTGNSPYTGLGLPSVSSLTLGNPPTNVPEFVIHLRPWDQITSLTLFPREKPSISISNGIVTSNQVAVGVGDIIKVETTVEKTY